MTERISGATPSHSFYQQSSYSEWMSAILKPIKVSIQQEDNLNKFKTKSTVRYTIIIMHVILEDVFRIYFKI